MDMAVSDDTETRVALAEHEHYTNFLEQRKVPKKLLSTTESPQMVLFLSKLHNKIIEVLEATCRQLAVVASASTRPPRPSTR